MSIPPVVYPLVLTAGVVGGLAWLAHTTKQAALPPQPAGGGGAGGTPAVPGTFGSGMPGGMPGGMAGGMAGGMPSGMTTTPPATAAAQLLQNAQILIARATINPTTVDPGQLDSLATQIRTTLTDPSALVIGNALAALAASTRAIQGRNLPPGTVPPVTTTPGGGGQGSGTAAVPAGATRTSLNIVQLTTPLPTTTLAPGTIFSTSDGLVEQEPPSGSPDQTAVASYRAYAARNPTPPLGMPTEEGVSLDNIVVANTARKFANEALQSGYPATALGLVRVAMKKDAADQALGVKLPNPPLVTAPTQDQIQAVSDANQVRFGVVTMPAATAQALVTKLNGLQLQGVAGLLSAFLAAASAPAATAASPAVHPAANAIAVGEISPALAASLIVTIPSPSLQSSVARSLTGLQTSAAVQRTLTELQTTFPNQFASAVAALQRRITALQNAGR